MQALKRKSKPSVGRPERGLGPFLLLLFAKRMLIPYVPSTTV